MNEKTLPNFGLVLGLIVAFVVSCVLSELAAEHYYEMEETRETTVITDTFPVVVIVNDEAKIVLGHALSEFKEKNSNYSFLVPIERKDFFSKQIEAHYNDSFKVYEIANNRQRFVVSAGPFGDDNYMNRSEYEASAKEIFPKYYLYYFVDGMTMQTMPTAFLGTTVIFCLGGVIWWFFKRRRRIV